MNTYLCEFLKILKTWLERKDGVLRIAALPRVEGNKKRRNGIGEGYKGI